MANNQKNKPKILGNDDDDFKTPADRARYNALHPYVPYTSNTEDDDFKTPADRAKYNAQHPYVPNVNSTSSRILGNGMKSGFNASYKKPDPVTDIFNKVYGPIDAEAKKKIEDEKAAKRYKETVDYFTLYPVNTKKDNTSAARWLAEETMNNSFDKQKSYISDLQNNKNIDNASKSAMLTDAWSKWYYLKNQIDSMEAQEQQKPQKSYLDNPLPNTAFPEKYDFIKDVGSKILSGIGKGLEIIGRPGNATINALRYSNAKPVTVSAYSNTPDEYNPYEKQNNFAYSYAMIHPELYTKEYRQPTLQEQINNMETGKPSVPLVTYTPKESVVQAALSGISGKEMPSTTDMILGESGSKKMQQQAPLLSWLINLEGGIAFDPLTYLLPVGDVAKTGLKAGINALRGGETAEKAAEAAAQTLKLENEASNLASDIMKNNPVQFKDYGVSPWDIIAKASDELKPQMLAEMAKEPDMLPFVKSVVPEAKTLSVDNILKAFERLKSLQEWKPALDVLDKSKGIGSSTNLINEIKNVDPTKAAMIMNGLLKVARTTGDYSKVMDCLRTLAPKTSNLDEGLKGAAWSENSPAGALLKAQETVGGVEDAVKKINPGMINRIDNETANLLENLKRIDRTTSDSVVEELKNINPEQPKIDAAQLLKKITAKTPQEKKLLQQVASDLFNTAESPITPINMPDVKPYLNTWNKAKDILLKQYKNNADARKIISNYFHKGIRPLSPISQLDTTTTGIGNIIRDYYMEDMDIRGELADWIAKKSGLGSKQSQSLAKSVQSTMDELTKTQKDELIKSYFNITPKNEAASNVMNRAKKFEPGLIPARESQIDKVMGLINRGSYTKSEIRDLIKAQNGLPVLSHNETAWIVNKIDRASRLPLGNKRNDLMGQVERFILEKRPSTLLDKANAGVDISTLGLNPKALALDTAIKAMLGSMEYTSDIAQVPFDKLMETITKQRVAAFPGISKELKGGWDGVKNAFSDTFGGVRLADLKGLTPVEKFKMLQEGFLNPINTMRAANKTEIVPNIAFKNNVARTLQNIANLSKRIGNMPFYEARYNGIINQQLRLHPELNGKPTQEMMDMAEKGALESILYDTNSISDATSWIKDLPQKIGNNTVRDIAQFAMDRTLLPISLKNESNAIKRALEYSPLGLLEGGAKLAWNLKKGPLTLEKQWEIGRRLARGTVGTTLGIGAGYAAKKAGIANGNANDDNDVAALKGKLSKRIPNSIAGYPYDWTLPISTPFDMGVRMAQPGKLSIPTFGMNLLKSYSDQPAYKIIQSLPGNQDDKSKGIKQRLLEAGMSYPMQYYPAVLKQAEQAGERYERETYSPNKIKASVVNPMLAQMPWLNRYLPTKVDSLGRPVPNPSPFDALINPANIPSSGSDLEEELLRLYYSTKDKKFFPKEADKTLTYWDKKNQQHTVNLTTEQFVRYQTILGQSTSKTYQSLMNNPAYKAATDQAKAKMLSEVLDQANEIVRKQMINDIQK